MPDLLNTSTALPSLPPLSRPDVTGNSIWPWVEPVATLPAARSAPRISIVTPNFNYAFLIEATMRSVLCQRYPNLEYIVIDGGSTDGSAEIIRRYEPHLAHCSIGPDKGQYDAINKGFAAATGEILGWLNSDDIYLPWTLRVVANIFSQFPQVQWITGHPSVLQDGVVHAMQPFHSYPRSLIQLGLFHGGPGGLGWIQQESCFWRRGLWEAVGGLRADVPIAADFDLWTRFAARTELYSVSTLLGGFSHRGTQNRSALLREQYMKDIDHLAEKLTAGATDDQRRDLQDVERFRRARGHPLFRRIAHRALCMSRFTGPVLSWNFETSAYRLEQRIFDRW